MFQGEGGPPGRRAPCGQPRAGSVAPVLAAPTGSPPVSGGLVGGPVGSLPLWCSVFFGVSEVRPVFSRVFGGCCFSITGFGGCVGCSCRRGDGDGLFAPLSSRAAMAWKLFDPWLEVVFPDGTPGPGSRPRPSAAARAPRAGRELLPHRISTGARTAFASGKQGPGCPRDTDRCLCPTPGEVLPNPSGSSPFQPHRLLLFVPEALSGTGGGAPPRPPSGPPLREAAEEKGQNQKTKNHPQPRGAQLRQRRLFPGQRKTRAKGQNSDLPPRRAPLPPPGGGARGRGAAPSGAGGGRGAEPGRAPASRGGFSSSVRPSGASAHLRGSFSRGLRMVSSPCSFLPFSPVCSPTGGGGVWASARPQELRPLWPGAVNLPEKSPK